MGSRCGESHLALSLGASADALITVAMPTMKAATRMTLTATRSQSGRAMMKDGVRGVSRVEAGQDCEFAVG